MLLAKLQGKRCINRSAWGGGTVVQTMRRSFVIIQYVINAGIDIGLDLFRQIELMTGVESPNLISFSVAVILIVAFTLETSKQTHTQTILIMIEAFVPGSTESAAMMRHTADTNFMSEMTFDLIKIVDTPEQAIEYIEHYVEREVDVEELRQLK